MTSRLDSLEQGQTTMTSGLLGRDKTMTQVRCLEQGQTTVTSADSLEQGQGL